MCDFKSHLCHLYWERLQKGRVETVARSEGQGVDQRSPRTYTAEALRAFLAAWEPIWSIF